MNYWLHRISYLENVSYPFLEKGYLTIGFSDFSNENFLKKTSKQDWDFFDGEIKREWKNLPRSRHSLWRFVAEMDKGDWVVVPSWGTFSIYEIVSPDAILPSSTNVRLPNTDWNGTKIIRTNDAKFFKLDKSQDFLDIGFLREVKLIGKDISRYEFADSALTSRMKIRTTNADINDLEQSIKKALDAYKKNKPINLKATLVESSLEIWLSSILEQLNDEKFERLIKWYFERVGATEVSIPAKNTKDKVGDVDVIAIFEKIKTIINVQVKFHRGETSNWALEQIHDFAKSKENMFDGYSRQYWVVSSSDRYSDESYRHAKEAGIQLIDGREFVQLLMDVGIDKLEGFQDT